MKRCSKCGQEKPLDAFYKVGSKEYPDLLRADCKTCHSARSKAAYPQKRAAEIARVTQWRLDNPEQYRETQRRLRSRPQAKARERTLSYLRRHGLSPDQFEEILARDTGFCHICGSEKERHLDHHHGSGQHRGWLCLRCNMAMGLLDEDINRLEAMLKYLELWNSYR